MKRHTAPAPGPSVNITPLSDIMLSLLIFFMLVSKTGVETGADADIDLPVAVLGVTEADFEQERAATDTLTVNVRESTLAGNPRVYGKYVLSGDAWEFVSTDPQTGEPTLQRFVQKFKGDRGDLQVRIHAGASTPYSDIEAVLRAVSNADVAGVQYAFDFPS